MLRTVLRATGRPLVKHRCHQAWVTVALWLLGIPSSLLAADASVDADTVARAWAKRESEVRTVRCTWMSHITTPKGTILSPDSLPMLNPKRVTVPPEDDVHTETGELWIDGEKWRYEQAGVAVSAQSWTFVPQRSVFVAKDGTLNAYMTEGAYDYPMGNINRVQKRDIPQAISIRPMFMVFRPLLSGLFTSQDYVALEGRGLVGTKSCVRLRSKKESGESKGTFWVDPENGFALLRYTLEETGTTVLKVDFTYDESDRRDRLPTGCAIVAVHSDGRLEQSITLTVRECVINRPIDPRQFQFDFPPGTWVRDFTRPSELGNTTQYIVRQGGSKRFLIAADRGATYQQLLTTESGQARIPHRFRLSHYLLIIGVVLSFITLLVILVRWLRSRKAERSNGGS